MTTLYRAGGLLRMKIAVTTDSSSGISPSEAEEAGISVIPIPIVIDGESFYEGADFTAEQLYAALDSGKRVSTSQPSPQSVAECWDGLLAKGYEIVHLPIARELSSSYDTACALAKGREGKVTVVDNHRISIPLREAVFKAKEMAEGGRSAAEIRTELEACGRKYGIYITVDTLEHLRRGGRISFFTAMAGSLLNIKPVLNIRDGKIEPVSRRHGLRKGIAAMFEYLKKYFAEHFSGEDTDRMTLGVAGTALPGTLIGELKEKLLAAFPSGKVYYNELPACVGCHTGTGAVGIGCCFD